MPVTIMGVLNVTPDSFSDGGRFHDGARADHGAAITAGLAMVQQGAGIIDVGGESTRPGADPVDPSEERARVVPVVEGLVAAGVTVSIDTRHGDVAEAALRAGATIVNDVSASLYDVAARHHAGYVAMHMLGDPRTMQEEPRYADVVTEVRRFLVERAGAAVAAGCGPVWIDPGIGFGKTAEHNWCLLKHLDALVSTGHPVVIGTSRKRFLGVAHAVTDGLPADRPTAPEDRLEGSLATAVWAMMQGVAILRVHDVRGTAQAAAIVG